jgi:hypothetical protein
MSASRLMRIALVIAGLTAALPSQAALRFHWSDNFSDAEKAQLQSWIRDTQSALEKLVGVPPFDIRVDMHRRDRAGEPVPWGNTDREEATPGVTFYVDMSYPPAAFRGDWTAPHELSHLVLPFLGPEGSWFSEGYASYMQYQIMQAMGVMSAAEVTDAYRAHLRRARKQFSHPRMPFAAAAPRLREERRYPAMYWGGAAYFLQADAALREKGSSVLAVLRAYNACCHREHDSLDSLVAELDRLAKSDVFAAGLKRFRTTPGFPDVTGMP